jgi:replicative DNA helicase
LSAAAENVIGGIIVGGKDAYWRIADILRPEDFPTSRLAEIYRICGEVAQSAQGLDIITVSEEVDRQLGEAAGHEVGAMAAATFSLVYLRDHAELVKSDAVGRRVRAICAAGAKSGDVATVQAELTALLSAQPSYAAQASGALKRMWESVLARREAGDDMTGLRTGIPLVDEWTGGLQNGRVYGIGARAKMGKTVLAMGICAHVALSGIPTAIWSLEMSDEELMQRMACAVSGLPSMTLQRPRLLDSLDEGWSQLTVAVRRLREAPLYVSDRTDVTIEQIESQARQMKASGQLSLLCIDYLGLLRMPKMDRHDLAVAHVTRRVKIIAKELQIPVILVFQLNRGSENGMQVRPPRPSDARDSGAIEQDLDAMFLLHRPSYYDKNAAKGLRLDLALQRNGQTGLIQMADELHCCRFTGGELEWKDPTRAGGRDDDL